MKKYINNIFLISVLLLCILAIINIVHTYNKIEKLEKKLELYDTYYQVTQEHLDYIENKYNIMNFPLYRKQFDAYIDLLIYLDNPKNVIHYETEN